MLAIVPNTLAFMSAPTISKNIPVNIRTLFVGPISLPQSYKIAL